MRRKLTVALIFGTALAIGLALGGLFQSPPSARSAPAKPQHDAEEMQELREFGQKFGKLFHYTAEEVGPSVVWIEAEKKVTVRRPGMRDPFFRRFFGPEFDDMFGPREREYTRRGLGSGFIIDREGHILTNNHVVAEADKLTVKLANGEEYDATISGADPSTELAVIQMEGEFGDLPVARLGDSDEINVGEWVIAIGNPLGLSHSVSAGIISAKGRSIGIARYENLIQTDAAINQGNSGGPLVNLQGEVIGINTAIVSRTGGNMGIGMAVPINMAKSILEDLKAGREIERGFLGIIGADLTPELARQFGYEGTGGALVNEVIEDTPAAKAGIKAGDIVIRWNDEEVEDFAHLRRLVARTAPGEDAKVMVWRDGNRKEFRVEVTRLADYQEGEEPSWLGVEVAPVTDEARNHYGRDNLQGVVVQEVTGGQAARVLEKDDVIMSVNRRRVRNVRDFQRLIGAIDEGEKALLHVLDHRTGHARFVLVQRP